MKYFLLPGILLILSLHLSAQTIPTPTQTDAIIIDNGAAGKADPNDRIRYNVTIQNTGAAPATGVQFNAVPDPRTTLVPGSFRSSPVATNDTYTATGNVPINVPAGTGVKANDFDDAIGLATLSCGTCLSAQNGTVVLNNDGSFTYTPPAGYTGPDNFTYTITDGNTAGVPAPLDRRSHGGHHRIEPDLVHRQQRSGRRWSAQYAFQFLSRLQRRFGGSGRHRLYRKHRHRLYRRYRIAKQRTFVWQRPHGGSNLSDVLNFTLAPNSVALPSISSTVR